MKRREFITLIGGGAAAAWPLAARAQQAGKLPMIGFLGSSTLSEASPWVSAFVERLRELGWTEGRNVAMAFRWAGGRSERYSEIATEFVGLKVDVIVTFGTPAALATKQATAAVPIVIALAGDPVGAGLVASLARPGGNVTGFTNINIESSIGGKWLELVKQIAPTVRRIAMIYNPPTSPFAGYYLRPFEAAGPAYGVQASAAAVDSDVDIENALAALAREPGGGFVVLPDTFTGMHRDQIVALAARYRLPAVYPFRWFAEIGGLLSYGIDSDDMFRRAASYVDRILKGAKPADLPVQAPTKYELIINTTTAKALGLNVPDRLLALADEVIE